MNEPITLRLRKVLQREPGFEPAQPLNPWSSVLTIWPHHLLFFFFLFGGGANACLLVYAGVNHPVYTTTPAKRASLNHPVYTTTPSPAKPASLNHRAYTTTPAKRASFNPPVPIHEQVITSASLVLQTVIIIIIIIIL